MLYQLYELFGTKWYERVEKEAFRTYFKVVTPTLIYCWIRIVSYVSWVSDILSVHRLTYILKNYVALSTILHGYLLQNDNYESSITGSRFYKKIYQKLCCFSVIAQRRGRFSAWANSILNQCNTGVHNFTVIPPWILYHLHNKPTNISTNITTFYMRHLGNQYTYEHSLTDTLHTYTLTLSIAGLLNRPI